MPQINEKPNLWTFLDTQHKFHPFLHSSKAGGWWLFPCIPNSNLLWSFWRFTFRSLEYTQLFGFFLPVYQPQTFRFFRWAPAVTCGHVPFLSCVKKIQIVYKVDLSWGHFSHLGRPLQIVPSSCLPPVICSHNKIVVFYTLCIAFVINHRMSQVDVSPLDLIATSE